MGPLRSGARRLSDRVGGELVYVGTKLFATAQDYTAATFTVPSKADLIFVRAWGSAGAPDTYANSNPGGDSGAGGYAGGLVLVTSGEQLVVGVGKHGYNAAGTRNGVSSPGEGNNLAGAANFSMGSYGMGSGGGFTGLLRGNSPLVIAGGGGGGQVNGPSVGGAGGGLSGGNGEGQSTSPGGTQTTGVGGIADGFANAAAAGGGGYRGGSNPSGRAGGGGSGFISPAVLFGELLAGNLLTPGGNDAAHEYPGGGVAVGGVGNDTGVLATPGIGYLILHCYGWNLSYPASPPASPGTRILL